MKIQKKNRTTNATTKRTASSVKATTNHDNAIEYIKCAISALGGAAKSGDTVAKDAVANLSVVLFDLK